MIVARNGGSREVLTPDGTEAKAMDRDTVSVTEAGYRLGIGRTTAYALARRGSIAGVPVIRIGRKLRVSVPALERLLGAEPDSKEVTR